MKPSVADVRLTSYNKDVYEPSDVCKLSGLLVEVLGYAHSMHEKLRC